MDSHPPASSPAAIVARTLGLPDVCVVEDLARFLRCSPSAVRALLRRGAIPGRKLGRRWAVNRLAFLESLRPDPPPGAGGLRLLSESDEVQP